MSHLRKVAWIYWRLRHVSTVFIMCFVTGMVMFIRFHNNHHYLNKITYITHHPLNVLGRVGTRGDGHRNDPLFRFQNGRHDYEGNLFIKNV